MFSLSNYVWTSHLKFIDIQKENTERANERIREI